MKQFYELRRIIILNIFNHQPQKLTKEGQNIFAHDLVSLITELCTKIFCLSFVNFCGSRSKVGLTNGLHPSELDFVTRRLQLQSALRS